MILVRWFKTGSKHVHKYVHDVKCTLSSFRENEAVVK